ncbi:MAG: DUF3048 domain-containing protein [Thermoclostridium sp.]|nr:DUF3048 domain-containing protein [Thermoclostridium sp.]
MKKFKIKLNKRGWILLSVVGFSIVTVSTVLIMGAIRNAKTKQMAGTQTDITPAPTPAIVSPVPTQPADVTITPTPGPRAEENFVFPKEGVRPIAVMIDNETSKVLPQGGIGIAQIVYEILVEYGDTRYMAIFYNNMPELVGPVRSSRHYFLDYAMEYDAIYAHIGWSDYAYRDLDLFEIDNIDGVSSEAGSVYWDLTRDRTNYHDSYTSPERINKFIGKAQYTQETEKRLPFEYQPTDTDLPEGQSAKEIFIKYSTNSNGGFYYDSELKNYKRTRLGEFQIDRNTDEPIRTKNILILHVETKNIPQDKYGRKDVITAGSGKGYFITNGLAQEITWEKSSRTSQTIYRNAKKEKIVLNPGQTWIQIVPLDTTVRIR